MPRPRTRMRTFLIVSLLAALVLPVGVGPAVAHHEAPEVDVLVTTFADTYDGACDDGTCSLRDAIAVAADGDVIGLPAGVFQLSLAGDGGIEVGDLDLDREVTITGVGQTGTFVDARSLGDRVFDIAGVDVRIERLGILGGSVGGRGGAIAVRSGGRLRLDLVTLHGSSARNGGAIAVTDAGLRMRNSAVLDAVATARGGGISAHGSASVRLDGASLLDGSARVGGGLWISANATLGVHRSTIARNEAARGGGVATKADGGTFRHATVARNRGTAGAAILSAGTTVVAASLLAGNRSGTGRPCVGDVTSDGANAGTRGTASCGLDRAIDVIARDLSLGPVSPAGGPTPTIALRSDSPAIDVGRRCGEHDQRGAPRDRRCDAGAYEFVRCLGRVVNVVGTPHDDELSGGRRNDGMLGLGGDDELQGSIGSDGICGGRGDDLLLGGPGNDRIKAGPGTDRLFGEDGDDRLIGGPGRNLLHGGPGRDVCLVQGRDVTRSCEVVRPLGG